MNAVRISCLTFVIASALLVSTSRAEGPAWRPCGPGKSCGGNRWLAQGGFGADFRPACATHDACLASGRSRRQCDREFYGNMNSACSQSRHPLLCRMRAFKYFAGARLFGGFYY